MIVMDRPVVVQLVDDNLWADNVLNLFSSPRRVQPLEHSGANKCSAGASGASRGGDVNERRALPDGISVAHSSAAVPFAQ